MTLGSGKAPGQRQLRVAEEIRHTLAHVFERREIRNPDLMDAVITITEVRMSADLKRAIVYFRPLGDQADISSVTAALKGVRGYLRRRIGERLRLRSVPDLDLRLDHSFDEAARIERLLREPKVLQDLEKSTLLGHRSGDG